MPSRSPVVVTLMAVLTAASLLAMAPASAGTSGSGTGGAETAVVSLTSMTGLTGGAYRHTCGLSDGAVYCWGSDSGKALGDGPGGSGAELPQAVTTAGTPLDGKTVIQVVSGYEFSCALTSDDVVACWGDNGFAQLGDGTTMDRDVPTAVATAGTPLDGADVKRLTAGTVHACALLADQTTACWGSGSQVGAGAGGVFTTPTALATAGSPLDGKDIATIVAGGFNTCALATDDTLACWGQNGSGQLGNGQSLGDSAVPVSPTIAGTALDGKTVEQISLGRYSTCALATDDTLACWGRNDNGQVGDGTTTERTTATAVTTAGTPLAASAPGLLASGLESHCAVLANTTIACWGQNDHGQLGDGSTTDRHVPTAVATAGTPLDGKSIKQLALNDDHTCAVPADAMPACWGRNSNGMLGTGTTDSSTTPVAVVLDPQPPTVPLGVSVSVSPDQFEATVTFSASADDGGVPITYYRIRFYEAGTNNVAEESNYSLPGSYQLDLGDGTWEVTVTAVNPVGESPESARTQPFTTIAPPRFPDGALYVPMTPCRILDTRQAGGPIADREIRDIAVADDARVEDQGGKAGGCDVPSDALAIEASVAAVDPADSGFFRAWPSGESMPNATFMNFDRGMDITNTGSIAIAPAPDIEGAVPNAVGDQLRIRNFGGASQYVIDVQGFYVLPPTQQATEGAPAQGSAITVEDTAIYVPITPCRILDTRQAGGTLADREIRDIAVADDTRIAAQGGKAGGCQLPVEALAIEASVAAVDPADSGFFRAWPSGESMPNATFMNFDRGMDITNTGSIAIAGVPAAPAGATTNAEGDQLRIRNFGGASHYVIDVQGVWMPAIQRPPDPNGATTSAVTEDPSLYEPMTPCRILDTRQAGGTLADREIRDISFTDDARVAAQGGKAGGCDVPVGTVAVEVSVTAVDPADSGFFRAWPSGESMPNATFMNFDRGMDITNTGSITIAIDEEIMSGATTNAVGDELRIRNFGGASHYVIDIQGYYPGLRLAPSD